MAEEQTLRAALVQFARLCGREQEADDILDWDRHYGGFDRRLELARAERQDLPNDRDDEWGYRVRRELFIREFVQQFQSLKLVAKACPITNGAPRMMIEPHMWDDLLIFDFQNSALEEYFEGGTRFVGVRVSQALAGAPREQLGAPAHLSVEDRIAKCGIMKSSPLAPWAKYIVENRILHSCDSTSAIARQVQDALPKPSISPSGGCDRIAKIYGALGEDLAKYDKTGA